MKKEYPIPDLCFLAVLEVLREFKWWSWLPSGDKRTKVT